MRYLLHPPFLHVPEEHNFPDAWEAFCCKLLNLEEKTSSIYRRKPPEQGIDLYYQEEHIAYQCKSVASKKGSFNVSNAIDSIESALKAQEKVGWNKYVLCTNVEITGTQEKKLRRALPGIILRPQSYWKNLCEKFPEQVKRNFYKLVSISDNRPVPSNSRAFLEAYHKELKNKFKKKIFNVLLYYEKEDKLYEIPSSPLQKVGDFLRFLIDLFGLPMPQELESEGCRSSLSYSLSSGKDPKCDFSDKTMKDLGFSGDFPLSFKPVHTFTDGFGNTVENSVPSPSYQPQSDHLRKTIGKDKKALSELLKKEMLFRRAYEESQRAFEKFVKKVEIVFLNFDKFVLGEEALQKEESKENSPLLALTPYHAKLYAHELTRRCPSDSVEHFTAALMDSRVDLNPHQVDAALFAFRSPLSRGAILADEVGLGKTIEAGIILSQKWAERKRKILIIVPSSLRKQWNQELLEKFYLPSQILEGRSFNLALKEGRSNPFDIPEIAICSYHFARNKADCIHFISWDLVVFDEAHRLRNVYKRGNKIARELKSALSHAPKLLLTATPLQNSLQELFGLVSFIDEHTFGDLSSFRSQFLRSDSDNNFDLLKERLQPICKRTLRRQVLEYIRFTERRAHTQDFTPFPEEQQLYDMVTAYLQTPELYALPLGQRALITLVLRKLLASSTFAIAGALEKIKSRLERIRGEISEGEEGGLEEDFEAFDELADELEIEEVASQVFDEGDQKGILEELEKIQRCHDLAIKITENAKGEALVRALPVGFSLATELGGAEKAIVFTESRRPQSYLFKLLSRKGYQGEIVLFNGTNNDDTSRAIYAEWKAKWEGSDQITGSKSADIRSALVDHFREKARIMIATEAAAEGINLQFCSLVVNYDLPWNPQRIEQRIGRCHRYGQKRDVVVVNFLNQENAADQRVYELLSEKFQLFSGVFGASDEVLGALESGVDFEKRIAEIYQTCRTEEEIQASFDALQAELGSVISENMKNTRQTLLENFDAEVAEKLNVYKAETESSLSKYGTLLWELTRYILDKKAKFHEPALSFELIDPPVREATKGKYSLCDKGERGHHYRIHHPLGQWVLGQALSQALPQAELVFHYSKSSKKISILKPFVGKSGVLTARKVTVKALDTEEYILLCAQTDKGKELDEEESRRLFDLPGEVRRAKEFSPEGIESIYEKRKTGLLTKIAQRNARFFDEEIEKLDRWAEDKKKGLELHIKELDREIGQKKVLARSMVSLEKKIEEQREIKKLEKKRKELRKQFFETQDKIDDQKDDLLNEIEGRMNQTIEESELFLIRWKLI